MTSAAAFDFKSKYTGQEKRTIKSLSDNDIKQLRAGKGWGLAKAAELNGIPGPSHLLQMKKEIKLSEPQTQKNTSLYKNMKQQAIIDGERLILLQQRLNILFANIKKNNSSNNPLTHEALDLILTKIADSCTNLRLVH